MFFFVSHLTPVFTVLLNNMSGVKKEKKRNIININAKKQKKPSFQIIIKCINFLI